MNSWISSYGSKWASSSYSLYGVPNEEPYSHLDLTKDESFFGDCCIYGDRLYIRTGGYDEEGILTCYDLKNNRIDWRGKYYFGHTSSMVIENDRLAIGYLVIDTSKGEVLFDVRDKFQSFEDDMYGMTYLVDNILYKTIDFYDLSSGYIRYDIEKDVISEISICDSSIKFIKGKILICTKQNKLYAYDLNIGSILWELLLEINEPIIHLDNDKVVVLGTHILCEVDFFSGEILHRSNLIDSMTGFLDCVPANLNNYSSCINNDFLVIYSSLGVGAWIMVIDRDCYEILYIKKDKDIGAVSICGDLIFYCNGKNKLQALTKNSDKVIWTSSENITARSIVSSNSYMVVGAIHGGFTIFKADT